MIEVRLQEDPRKFEVRIGDKLVGRVTIYAGSGRVQAEIVDRDYSSGYRWVEGGFRTIKQATNRILRTAGYGNCQDITVQKCKGFRIR